MVHDLPTTPQKPTVLIVPGAACPSKPFYQPLCDVLNNKYGYATHTHDLPTASRSPPETAATLADDVAVFHDKLAILVEDGKDIVLIAHSYGGVVATDAAEGFAKVDREAQGLRGGIVKIVYLTCIVIGVGETAGEVCSRSGLDFKIMGPTDEDADFLAQIPGETAAKVVFSDLPTSEALLWQSRQSLQSAICYTAKAQYDAYRHIPTIYIVCTNDLVLPLDFQRGRVEFLKSVGAKELQVVEMETGHCPNVSAVEETASTIVKVIEGTA